MMHENELPSFIRNNIASVWALEVLLLLRRDPGRVWRVADIVKELRAANAMVQSILTAFEQSGLVAMEAGESYRFSPASAVIAELCDATEQAYRQRPVTTISLISAPLDRLQSLADAFRFKGGRS